MLIKSTLIAAAIGVVVASAIGGIFYGAVVVHDAYADGRYIKQETYQQSINQQRIWTLEDRERQIRSKANAEGRALTTYESDELKTIKKQIESLRGW